jgi:neutral ceramidase
VFAAVTRRSGRPVRDGDLLLTYTPLPLVRSGAPRRHVWAVEWQAVPWLGAPGLDDLGDRAGVPLGRYRFHVIGDGWAIDSDPFEVVAGGVELAASRTGTALTATASLHAPRGFRLLDLSVPSNRAVPLRSRPVTVALVDADGGVLDQRAATTTAGGQIAFDDPDVAKATTVRVTDEFGNVATAAL